MNRTDLIERVAEATETYKYEAEKFIKALEDVMIDALQNGEKIHLHGLLDFTIREFREKEYTNPMTGEKSLLPASKKIKVSVSKKLNEKIQ